MGQQLAALRPEGVEELTHGLLAAALGDPRDRAPVVVGDHHQVLILALAPGLLIDPDPPQPRQPVPPRRRVRRDPGHDAFHRVPRDPQFLRGLRPRHLRGEPCRVQLKHRSKPVGVRGPRHRRGDLPVLGTDDPRHLRLDERPLAVHIQRPPPPDIGLHAFAAGAALRAPATASRLRLHHDDQDLLRRAALPRPRLDIRRDHHDALAVEHLIPHRPGHRTNPRSLEPPCPRPGRYPRPACPLSTDTLCRLPKTPIPERTGEPHTDYRRPYATYHDAFDAARALFFFSITWG